MAIRNVLVVARWEFLRFVKLKQQALSLAVMMALGAGGGFIGNMVAKSRSKPVTVALVNAERLGAPAPLADGVTWRPTQADETALRTQLDAKDIAGYVVIESPDSIRIVLREKATWPTRVQSAMTQIRRQRLVAALGITPAQLAALSSEMGVATSYTKQRRASERSDKAVAFGVLFLVFTGVITGVSYLFTGITGEKQTRVTESILSSISPQEWLDGKIFGQLAVALVSVLNLVLSMVALAIAVAIIFRDKVAGMSLPAVNPWLVVQVVVLVLLGMVLWYVVLGAFTATIDDPNNSMRSASLMLPMLPLFLGWIIQDKADSLLATVLSQFPLTSYAVLPVRLAVTSPSWWEFPLATVILVVTIALLRRLAGRIFTVGVQMYGKEPTWGEMWRAIVR
ncbi:MAG: ABC transporter permease [Gemmatimonadaceae bacterium]|nr:ABC transporter permease [Gemmatimonadaceae bacterium]